MTSTPKRCTEEAGLCVCQSLWTLSVLLHQLMRRLLVQTFYFCWSACVEKVPVFQRGGSVICRSVGSGTCTADFHLLPLDITVAINSQVKTSATRISAEVYHMWEEFPCPGT